MEKYADVGHSDQQPRSVDAPNRAQLHAANGQVALVRIADVSPDNARLCSPTDLGLTSGQDVSVLLPQSTRRFAMVQHVACFGTGYDIGVKWKCALHRDAIRAAVLLSNKETLSDRHIRLRESLPDLLYNLWQLMDAGRLPALVEVVTRFEDATDIAGYSLVAKCHELKDAIETGAPDETVANVLDELCKECVLQTVRGEPAAPGSTPVLVKDALSARAERPKQFLGASGWVVGTVVVLAGHLLITL